MSAPTYLYLDETGTQAGIYPSEDQLWASGPPINDPGDQGIAISGVERGGPPPVPNSLKEVSDNEALLDEQLNGETPNGAFEEVWVNPLVFGPTGYGPYNDPTNFQTGHSQNVVSNPASEQGWGVGPARRWAHYPQSQAPNPERNMGQRLRNGQLPWVTADSSLYERSQLAWEQQWAPLKHRSPVAPVVPVPASVPFVQTVPTFAGGDVTYAGIDYPYAGQEGIYWR